MAKQDSNFQAKLARACELRDQMQEIESGLKDGQKPGREYLDLKEKRDEIVRSLTGPETMHYNLVVMEALRYARAEKNGRLDELKKWQDNHISLKARLSGKPKSTFANEFNAQSRDSALTKQELAELAKQRAEANKDLRNQGRGDERTFRSDFDDAVDRNYAAEGELYDALYPKRHDRSDNIDEETQARRQSEVDRILYKGNTPRSW